MAPVCRRAVALPPKVPHCAPRGAQCHGKTGREGPNDVLVGRLNGEGFPFSRDPTLPHDRQLLAVRHDGVRLHPPRDAARRAGIARDDDVYALVATCWR